MQNAFLEGASILFTFASNDWYKIPSDEEATRSDWKHVGDYIRGAMNEVTTN